MATKVQETRFVICVAAREGDDLVVGKAYRVLPDRSAVDVGCLRIVDESGEDYLYPARRFVAVNVPQQERRRLLKAVATRS